MKNPWRVIVKPVVTEKSTRSTQSNVHTFVVDGKATKHDIKYAVQTAFGVQVARVRTSIVKGKPKRMKNMRLMGRRKNYKKAYVTLKEGSRLDLI